MSEGQSPYSASSERPTAVTVIAISNIVFALLCSCVYCTWTAMPAMMDFQKPVFRQIEREIEAEQKKEIARLLQKRQAAKTQQERQQIDAQIIAIKAAKMPEMSKLFEAFTAPQMKAFYYGVGIVGIVLNLLFLVSGVGLLAMASWARKLAIGVSILRILEVLFSTAYNIFVIAPAMGQAMQEWFEAMQKAVPPGAPPPPMPNMTAFMQFWSVMGSLFTMVLHCAWPTVVLIVLFLPSVQEAFRSR